MNEIVCYDKNNTKLTKNDAVMCITGTHETEGIIVELLTNNQIKVETENGIITVSASDSYWLPS